MVLFAAFFFIEKRAAMVLAVVEFQKLIFSRNAFCQHGVEVGQPLVAKYQRWMGLASPTPSTMTLKCEGWVGVNPLCLGVGLCSAPLI